MQVGVQEEYLVGKNGDGALYLDDLSRPTRSYSWEHSQDFGKARVNIDAAYERYDEHTPYTTRTGFSLSRPAGTVNLYLNSSWSSFQGDQDASAELSGYLPPLGLGKTHLSLSFAPYVGYRRTIAVQTEEQPGQTNDNFYQGLRAGLGFPVLRLLGGVLTTTMNNEIAHSADGTFTNFFDAGVNYRRDLARNFSTNIAYSYGASHSTADAASPPPSQRLSLGLSGHIPRKWELFVYSSYDLVSESLYSSLGTIFCLPWGRMRDGTPRWSLQYHGNMTSGPTSTADHLFSLGWNIGVYTILAHYSPTGNTGVTGIGTASGKRWAIEIARQGW
jgi:outer membrane usher protein FimD/PapC